MFAVAWLCYWMMLCWSICIGRWKIESSWSFSGHSLVEDDRCQSLESRSYLQLYPSRRGGEEPKTEEIDAHQAPPVRPPLLSRVFRMPRTCFDEWMRRPEYKCTLNAQTESQVLSWDDEVTNFPPARRGIKMNRNIVEGVLLLDRERLSRYAEIIRDSSVQRGHSCYQLKRSTS